MGEYADDFVDYLIGQEFDRYDYDPFGDDHDEYGAFGGYIRRHWPARKTCQRCGARNLFWSWEIPGEWKLADPATGEVHTCPAQPLSAFEDLDA